MRYQPPLASKDASGQFAELSRVLDAREQPPAFAPSSAAIIQVGAGETKRLAPRAAGQTVILPASDETNYGALVTLLVDGTLGTCKVKPISGTLNGAASFTLAAGYQSLLVLMSDGAGRWLTERAEGYPLTDGDKGDITVSSGGTVFNIDANAVGAAEIAAGAVGASELADASILPAKLAPAAASMGVIFAYRTSYAAAAAGTPDDVTIYSANAPFDYRIMDVIVLTSTAIGASTVTLRDTSGGGGSALSSAISTGATGTARNNDTVSDIVTAGSSLFIRRSDRGVAGELIIIGRPA